jgi:hypothetical protein
LQIPDVSDLKEYAQTISTLCIRDWSVDNDGAVDGRFLGNGPAQEPVDGPWRVLWGRVSADDG